MSGPSASRSPIHFFDLEPHELDQLCADWSWPAYRAKQLRIWVYQQGVTDPQQMSNFSKADRQRLAEVFVFTGGRVDKHQDSSDGTQKLLISWPDGASAETVMIPDGDRRTACVSSQVGCPVGCAFCASGIGGVKGNLSAGQIVEQIYALQSRGAAGRADTAINRVVFMGMGEPMANYNNVLKAVRILHHQECFNLSARRITISTVGVPPKIRELADQAMPLNLALSLHAPDETLRRQLIPWAHHFQLNDILDACRYYFSRTGREITLEYILLREVNDRPEQACQLVRLCRTIRANVNLIYYNEVESLAFRRPRGEDVAQFQAILRDGGVNTHIRKSRGRDIDAACGQLRKKQQEQKDQQNPPPHSQPLPVLADAPVPAKQTT
ncbi:MAG: 23S rRNA (adenine(2503)-C(2))-methyltransferase RlmN [Phycisphaerales bacterium]|nr:23S rRNA (adenine(2503)-C(2))-methyltransferase RlmN [Phycisphaerales bacterium]